MAQLHPHFTALASPASLSDLAKASQADLLAGAPDMQINAVAPLAGAGPGLLVWLRDADRLAELKGRSGYVLITTQILADQLVREGAGAGAGVGGLLVCDNPRAGFARAAARLYPEPAPQAGIAAGAVIDPSANIADSAEIGPNCVIGPAVLLGPRSILGAGVQLAAGTIIGAECHIGAGCLLQASQLGDRCVLKPGSIIGGAGFGFEPTAEGPLAIPHLGGVEIGPDCHIGSGCTIDRGGMGATRIGAGVKIDNQVHIAHNVQIGDHTIIAGQTGIAGSAVIGARCLIGAQAGIADHVRIADDTVLLARAGVTKSLAEAGVYGGFPAQKAKDYWKELASLRRLRLAGRKEASK